MAKGKRKAEAHVRLYRHELMCDAYRSLSPAARSLLVEFRALFNGNENQIHMSLRQVQSRLSVGRHVAEKALSELLDRGWIDLLEQGSFHQKSKHASVYALTSHPTSDHDGATASKKFMRWKPPDEAETATKNPEDTASIKNHGVDEQHRRCRSPAPSSEKAPQNSTSRCRSPAPSEPKSQVHGVGHQHTDIYTRGCSYESALLPAALLADQPAQSFLCLFWLCLGTGGEQ